MLDTKSLDPSKILFGEIVSPGTKFLYRKVLKLNKIYSPSGTKSQNPTRSKGKSAQHIEKLKLSINSGIDYSEMPPVVMEKSRLEHGEITEYDLICGWHRMEALKQLGAEEWIFDVYEIPHGSEYGYEDAVRTLQLMENDHSPTFSSTEDDVVNTIVRLIANKSKLVEPIEDSIRDYVNLVCKNMHHGTKGKIVSDSVRKLITNGCQVYRDVVTYTADDVREWMKKNTDYVCGGEFDFKRKAYGWSVLEGYEYEFLVNAIKRYSDTGMNSYFTLHTKSPTEKFSVDDRRKKMKQQFSSLESDLLKVFEYYKKNKNFPWHIEGCLPQIVATEEKYINS